MKVITVNSKDYKNILDTMQDTGVYVIREDDHKILYFNKRVQDVMPHARKGATCHELWSSCCSNCPLLGIEGKNENRVVQHDTPFGHVVDITATRTLWQEKIPAFIISITPHMVAFSPYDIQMAAILKSRYSVINTLYLSSNQCERVFLNQESAPQEKLVGDYAHYIHKALSIVHPDDVKQFQNVLSLEHIRSQAAETEGYREEICQYRLEVDPVQWVEQHVVYTKLGGDVQVNILGRDITREKELEAKRYQERQHRIDVIHSLSSMFFATYYVNLQHDLFLNSVQAAEDGKAADNQNHYTEALCNYANRFVHPEDRVKYLDVMGRSNLLRSLRQDNPFVAFEYRRLSAGPHDNPDKYDWVRASAVLVQTDRDGNPRTMLYAAQDVTASKERELQEHQALRAACDAANYASSSKSEFMSKMSHEIRTPLNGIIGMAAIATTHANDSGRVMDCLNKITVSSMHLLSLINKVMDMNQLDSGKADLAEDIIRIPELMAELADNVYSSVQLKGHELKLHPIKLNHETVIGDRVRLLQIFENILENAVKYTPPGGILELAVTEKDVKEYGCGCYEFIFRDNGIGMTEDFAERIFLPFTRAEDSRISKIEGLGLGMTIAQNIVRMMGGSIGVKSILGIGSEFTVTLLLKYHENKTSFNPPGASYTIPYEELYAASPEDFFEKLSFKGKRILLAEDNEINWEIAAEIIGSAGASVEHAVNGKNALEWFSEKGEGYYDLIFMDIQMPEMDGYAATRAIRKLPRSDAASIPIIAMSANALLEDIVASRDAGMNEYLTKPLDVPHLMACMDYWLNRQHL